MDRLQVLVLLAMLFTNVILDRSQSVNELGKQCDQQTNNHESCDSKDQKDASQSDYWGHPNCFPGRHTIVHLFEWKWSDIAAECETFLGPHGYCGVQVSPPSENRVVIIRNHVHRPWWERYQPVSYKLVTRSGSETQFTNMVERCNKVNVTIYVDAVINHMTKEETQDKGTGGSSFEFDGEVINYPAVHFSSEHFNGKQQCPNEDLCIKNYNNKDEVRNCRLQGLADLNQGNEYVQGKIVEYMNKLIEKGVAGFRVDAAKHMWPKDLKAIYEKLENLNSASFPDSPKPFIFHEVIDMGSKDEAIHASEYTDIGRVTNFIFGVKLAEVFRGQNQAKWLNNWGEIWNMLKTTDVVVFVDNHDNQRGHGAGGDVLTHKDHRLYKMATAFMLAHHYGFTRVMSSFSFPIDSTDQGPPHDEDMSIKDVISGSDTICGNGWVCEHRWRQIHNMVAFRNVVHGTVMENWWDNDNNQIAFSRGSKGFIAINADKVNLEANLYTGLPEGIYCDVISGNYEDCMCTGRGIHVRGDGTAYFHISSSSEDPMVAIHIGARIGSKKKVTT